MTWWSTLPDPSRDRTMAWPSCCIRHGVHYLDLADDAAFVRGIDRLHEAALKASVLVCAGASTAPAITGAVVEEALKTGPVERVAFGIMPGNDAPRGPALVATIAGQRGQADRRSARPPRLGRACVACGCRDSAGAGWRACDLPEPALFARRFGIRDTFAGAGMEVSIFHVGLWLLSWLVRLGLVRTLGAHRAAAGRASPIVCAFSAPTAAACAWSCRPARRAACGA